MLLPRYTFLNVNQMLWSWRTHSTFMFVLSSTRKSCFCYTNDKGLQEQTMDNLNLWQQSLINRKICCYLNKNEASFGIWEGEENSRDCFPHQMRANKNWWLRQVVELTRPTIQSYKLTQITWMYFSGWKHGFWNPSK